MARQSVTRVNEDMILEMLRLEYDRRLEKLGNLDHVHQEQDNAHDVQHDAQTVVVPGLVLKHKKTGIEYSVVQVGGRDALLRTPEGEEMTVGIQSISTDYLID